MNESGRDGHPPGSVRRHEHRNAIVRVERNGILLVINSLSRRSQEEQREPFQGGVASLCYLSATMGQAGTNSVPQPREAVTRFRTAHRHSVLERRLPLALLALFFRLLGHVSLRYFKVGCPSAGCRRARAHHRRSRCGREMNRKVIPSGGASLLSSSRPVEPKARRCRRCVPRYVRGRREGSAPSARHAWEPARGAAC